jgi:hypothetical protein
MTFRRELNEFLDSLPLDYVDVDVLRDAADRIETEQVVMEEEPDDEDDDPDGGIARQAIRTARNEEVS